MVTNWLGIFAVLAAHLLVLVVGYGPELLSRRKRY